MDRNEKKTIKLWFFAAINFPVMNRKWANLGPNLTFSDSYNTYQCVSIPNRISHYSSPFLSSFHFHNVREQNLTRVAHRWAMLWWSAQCCSGRGLVRLGASTWSTPVSSASPLQTSFSCSSCSHSEYASAEFSCERLLRLSWYQYNLYSNNYYTTLSE